MLLHPSGHREDVGVKNNVFRREVDLFCKELVGPFAYRYFVVGIGCLTILVKRHNDDGGSIITDSSSLLEERIFPFF